MLVYKVILVYNSYPYTYINKRIMDYSKNRKKIRKMEKVLELSPFSLVSFLFVVLAEVDAHKFTIRTVDQTFLFVR